MTHNIMWRRVVFALCVRHSLWTCWMMLWLPIGLGHAVDECVYKRRIRNIWIQYVWGVGEQWQPLVARTAGACLCRLLATVCLGFRETKLNAVMPSCFVPKCSHSNRHSDERGSKCAFFRFPKDPVLKKQWVQSVRYVYNSIRNM